jgi:hypothetical protein
MGELVTDYAAQVAIDGPKVYYTEIMFYWIGQVSQNVNKRS